MCKPNEEVPNCAKCHAEEPFEVWAGCRGLETGQEEKDE